MKCRALYGHDNNILIFGFCVQIMSAGSQTKLNFSVRKTRSSSKRSNAAIIEPPKNPEDSQIIPAVKRLKKNLDTESLEQNEVLLPVKNESVLFLEKVFNAVDICVKFHLSINTKPTFVLLENKVSGLTKISFKITHLAQILTVWPESFAITPCFTIHQGKRVATYELSYPRNANLPEAFSRSIEFKRRLEKWLLEHCSETEIPAQQLQALPSLSKNTVNESSLVRKLNLEKSTSRELRIPTQTLESKFTTSTAKYANELVSCSMLDSSSTLSKSVNPKINLKSHQSSSSVQNSSRKLTSSQLTLRQSSLFDRVRKKQKAMEAKKAEEFKNNLVVHTLAKEKVSFVRIIDLIFVQLSTWPTKRSFSMSEIVTSMQMSISSSLSPDQCAKAIELLSKALPAWCTINLLGNIQVVTFSRIVNGKPYLRSQLIEELQTKASITILSNS